MRKYRFMQPRHVPTCQSERAIPHRVGQVIAHDEIAPGHLHSLLRQRVLVPVDPDPAAPVEAAEEQAPAPEVAQPKPAKGKKGKKKKEEAGEPAPSPEEGAGE